MILQTLLFLAALVISCLSFIPKPHECAFQNNHGAVVSQNFLPTLSLGMNVSEEVLDIAQCVTDEIFWGVQLLGNRSGVSVFSCQKYSVQEFSARDCVEVDVNSNFVYGMARKLVEKVTNFHYRQSKLKGRMLPMQSLRRTTFLYCLRKLLIFRTQDRSKKKAHYLQEMSKKNGSKKTRCFQTVGTPLLYSDPIIFPPKILCFKRWGRTQTFPITNFV